MSDDPLALASEFPAVTRADWLGAVGKVLNGASLQDALVKRNHDGVAVHPLYTADERPAAQMPELGGRNWHIRTAYDVSDAIAANAAILEDLECGATAITLGFGDGAPNSVDDLDSLLDGVFLDMAPVALEAGAAFRPAAELLQALWERRGIAPEKALGAFNADPIGISAQSIADAAELARETAGKYPGVTSIAVDTHRYHAAGASEAQEVAAGLATGVAYLRAMEAVGLAPEAAARQIVFTLAADADLFLTIAKFRAFRRAWASVLAACGVAGPAPARIEAVTAWRMMTRTDPWVNMLRTTAAAFAAGVAGADAILVRPFDAASKAPDGFSRRIARNIQIILQEESGLGQVIDPAAGSYAIERLTADLADAAWAAFQAIESAGGMAPALESGFVQGEIAKARAALEADVATRRRGITGTSRFPNLDEPALAPLASSAPPR
ncbi:MAG: methylmalonyl-CoA mutase subunit beta, partial [Sphingomonadales bacterium]|nr:methylmalonyl-CoA mutase subunit beta [Sphingomonadales bacterium]